MASIVAAMALTHEPGLTGWFTAAPEDQQVVVRDSMKELRRRLEAAHPDVIVAFSNDHLLNWPVNNTPEYTVGDRRRARRTGRLVRRMAGTEEVACARPSGARAVHRQQGRPASRSSSHL